MEFEVRQTKMQSVGSNLTDIKSTLTKLRGNINEVSSNLNRSDRAMASIQQNLKSLASGLEKTATRVGSLSSGITQAATWYTKYEKEICGAKADITAVAITSTAGTTASGGDEEKKNSFEWTSKNWWDLIKNAGFLGSTVSTIRGAITGDGSAKSWTSILKSLTKTIGTGASLVKTKSSGGNWSQYLWGVNNALSGLTTTSWGKTFLSSMKKQFTNDLTWGTGATAADKVKVATKWGGHALTLASDAFDNYDEYKNSNGTMSAGRAVA